MVDGVVVDYKDIHKDALEKSVQCATNVPYFEGDYWPNVLEESIKVCKICSSNISVTPSPMLQVI